MAYPPSHNPAESDLGHASHKQDRCRWAQNTIAAGPDAAQSDQDQASAHTTTCQACQAWQAWFELAPNQATALQDTDLTEAARTSDDSPKLPAELLAAIQNDSARPLAKIFAMRTLYRRMAAFSLVALFVAYQIWSGLRPDWHSLPILHPLVVGASLFLALVYPGSRLIASAATPRPHPKMLWARVFVAWSIPVFLAFLPPAYALTPQAMAHADALFWPHVIRCLIYGTCTGALALIGLIPFLRPPLQKRRQTRTFELGLFVVLAGNLSLAIHCPAVGHSHRFLGHAGLIPLMGAALWPLVFWLDRHHRRARPQDA